MVLPSYWSYLFIYVYRAGKKFVENLTIYSFFCYKNIDLYNRIFGKTVRPLDFTRVSGIFQVRFA